MKKITKLKQIKMNILNSNEYRQSCLTVSSRPLASRVIKQLSSSKSLQLKSFAYIKYSNGSICIEYRTWTTEPKRERETEKKYILTLTA